MNLIVYYDKHILTTKLICPISIKDIITNVRNALKDQKISPLVFNSNMRQLWETEKLQLKSNQTILYFIPKKPTNTFETRKKEEPIESLIMKATDAKEKIKYKKPLIKNNKSPFDFTEWSSGDNNLRRLLSVLQTLEDRALLNPGIRWGRPSQQSEVPNENYVNQWKEMGFPEASARSALIRTRNNLSRATDFLLGWNEGNNEYEGDDN